MSRLVRSCLSGCISLGGVRGNLYGTIDPQQQLPDRKALLCCILSTNFTMLLAPSH